MARKPWMANQAQAAWLAARGAAAEGRQRTDPRRRNRPSRYLGHARGRRSQRSSPRTSPTLSQAIYDFALLEDFDHLYRTPTSPADRRQEGRCRLRGLTRSCPAGRPASRSRSHTRAPAMTDWRPPAVHPEPLTLVAASSRLGIPHDVGNRHASRSAGLHAEIALSRSSMSRTTNRSSIRPPAGSRTWCCTSGMNAGSYWVVAQDEIVPA